MIGPESAAVWPENDSASCSSTAATAAVTAFELAVLPLLQLHHSMHCQPFVLTQGQLVMPFPAPNISVQRNWPVVTVSRCDSTRQ